MRPWNIGAQTYQSLVARLADAFKFTASWLQPAHAVDLDAGIVETGAATARSSTSGPLAAAVLLHMARLHVLGM